jgi:hypothetical protein
MFSHTITRTVLGAVLAPLLLVPAALAADSARGPQVGLDPAIATAIHNRAEATASSDALDPAIATAMRNRAAATSTTIPLDPPLLAAMLEHEARVQARAQARAQAHPDNRAGVRGVGSLPQPAPVATSGSFDWSNVGLGAGAALAALLLALGSATAVRHARTRITNA